MGIYWNCVIAGARGPPHPIIGFLSTFFLYELRARHPTLCGLQCYEFPISLPFLEILFLHIWLILYIYTSIIHDNHVLMHVGGSRVCGWPPRPAILLGSGETPWLASEGGTTGGRTGGGHGHMVGALERVTTFGKLGLSRFM